MKGYITNLTKDTSDTDTGTETRKPPVSFRDAGLDEQLELRAADTTHTNQVAKRDLNRYYTALRRERPAVAKALTRGEKLAVIAISNGTFWSDEMTAYVWAEVADADDEQLAQWGVDRDALVAKLRAFTPTQTLALIDAVECWWLLPDGVASDHDAGLAAVGLA